MSGLKKYLDIKEILAEDDLLREEFESLWDSIMGGFYNYNQDEYNILIDNFMEFYELLAQLSDLPKGKDPNKVADISINRRGGK